jgi:hypothetical protein
MFRVQQRLFDHARELFKLGAGVTFGTICQMERDVSYWKKRYNRISSLFQTKAAIVTLTTERRDIWLFDAYVDKLFFFYKKGGWQDQKKS